MGGSNSKASQTIENNTVNQNFMNTVNKNIMNNSVETMINNASSCSSAVNVNNSCDISGAKIGGDFTFGGNQTAKATVNFSCIQANTTSVDMATTMMNTMVSEMKSLNGTDAAANLNTASQSSNKTGFASMPGSAGANSSSSTNVTNNVTNETISNVENIFEQNLSNNFTANTVNECIGRTSVSNSQDLSNIEVGGNARIECIQSASVEQVQNCKQLNDAVSKTTTATFQELGLTVSSENTTGSTTESTVSATAENVATGPIQEMGDAIANIAGALGLGFLGPFLVPSICCCCCLIIIVVLFFVVTQGMGSSGSIEIPNMETMSNMYDIPNSTSEILNQMGQSGQMSQPGQINTQY